MGSAASQASRIATRATSSSSGSSGRLATRRRLWRAARSALVSMPMPSASTASTTARWYGAPARSRSGSNISRPAVPNASLITGAGERTVTRVRSSRPVPIADDMISALALAPHPEGGFYRETWRDVHAPTPRARSGTAIDFLLRGPDHNRWHKVGPRRRDLARITTPWRAASSLWIAAADDDAPVCHDQGADVAGGERLQVIVPLGAVATAALHRDAHAEQLHSLAGVHVRQRLHAGRAERAGPGQRR